MSDDTVLQQAIQRDKPITAKRAALLMAERDEARTEAAQYRHANSLAAQAYSQLDGRVGELESKLGQALEALARRETEREEIKALLITMRRYIIRHDVQIGECVAWNDLKQQFGIGQSTEADEQWLKERTSHGK